MKWFAAAAISLLVGCSTMSDTAGALAGFKGQNIQTLIDRIGYPDRQEPVVDKTAYYWGGEGMDDENAAVCQLKAVAGSDRIIVDTSIYGNIMGCEQVLKSLRHQ